MKTKPISYLGNDNELLCKKCKWFLPWKKFNGFNLASCKKLKSINKVFIDKNYKCKSFKIKI